ncbi:MAG: bifunctional glutamate N-acetyltransferase/amino-acid acetyltransferase ArgJ [Gammaproteobacteria bacterium]|nr:bifunctional glutamate N-acetyltransferase/amino-acid acetyltransferase ArgJ [Gammaproteobacteria bacterium]NIR82255.1 bifunctional glutamate N-acetyltransferase/amino-acid acetyltransferase ArgJ [Gammaproteobacteria bacterium]NIR91186.1 bifunctional glutamate N-acetyltransferase/amino-acid acetyltransferase ArgJ [Gammaproteobacteria bacterium]NIU03404.1 bifunctional glutamate N-acetyltransferase/amino-acid acetyltransferase ArgJ [Gammaproteobacteria bacterium]NIX84679.1 bifunctional glutama
MAVGLKELSSLHPVDGIRVGTARGGIRYPDREDVAVFELAPGSHCAAVFTRNAFLGAPVRVAREHLAAASPRYLLINTGNANAGTGTQGVRDARTCCELLAEQAGVAATEVLPFSTGVIGEPLPIEPFGPAIEAALAALDREGWARAARAIMTTDTVPKGTSRRASLEGNGYTITGIAKGSGMIRPDMATMLAFIGTDAHVAPRILQSALERAVSRSFNRITVDGDTSTNDACILMATGQSAAPPVDREGSETHRAFVAALDDLCAELAQMLVRDAEGATRFVTVRVAGGASEAECLDVAYTIAHSPLVKAAFFAGDPNWGRILAAVGRAGLHDLAVDGVRIWLDDVCIVDAGERAPDYTEAQGVRVMRQDAFSVRVELGRGDARATVWTSDLSYDYVKINAEYRS